MSRSGGGLVVVLAGLAGALAVFSFGVLLLLASL